MIYVDKAYDIHRLEHSPGYSVIAEVYKENGKRIAVLFQGDEADGTQKESAVKTGPRLN